MAKIIVLIAIALTPIFWGMVLGLIDEGETE